MVRLQTCCCCSLRTGTLVIGYFNIIATLFSIILSIVLWAKAKDERLNIAVAVILTILSFRLLVNSLMVYGVHEGKPGFMIAWLLLAFPGLVVSTVLVIINSAKVLMRGADSREYVAIFLLIPLLIGLSWYLYLVVYSCYKELCDDLRHERPENKTYNYSEHPIAIIAEQ